MLNLVNANPSVGLEELRLSLDEIARQGALPAEVSDYITQFQDLRDESGFDTVELVDPPRSARHHHEPLLRRRACAPNAGVSGQRLYGRPVDQAADYLRS